MVELTKTCPKCWGVLTLISKEPWATNQPIRRYQHDDQPIEQCPYWEPTYSQRKDEA